MATAALMTAAMGATAGAGAGQAAWYDDILPIASCEGGSRTVDANIDCQWSIAPPVTGLLPVLGLDIDLNSEATAREDVTIPIPIFPDIEIGGTTANISGVGLAYANSFLGAPGSSAEAHAWGFLSGAVAVSLPPDSIPDLLEMDPGHTRAISLPLGVTVAAAGSGEATAFALGGFATAVGFTDLVENVSCMALVSYASHSEVGSCVGVLFIFSGSQVAGSPEYVFAIADPTSLTFLSDQGLIGLPIPNFDRDILRVGVGGPSGLRVETDLFQSSSGSSGSARTAAAPVSFEAPAEDVPAAEQEVTPTTYIGKHRAPDAADATETETETDTGTPAAEAPETADVSEDGPGTTDAADPGDEADAEPGTSVQSVPPSSTDAEEAE